RMHDTLPVIQGQRVWNVFEAVGRVRAGYLIVSKPVVRMSAKSLSQERQACCFPGDKYCHSGKTLVGMEGLAAWTGENQGRRLESFFESSTEAGDDPTLPQGLLHAS